MATSTGIKHRSASLLVAAIAAATLVIVCAAGFVWWRYVPARDGVYVFGNELMAWHVAITNGAVRTLFLENRVTGARLDVAGEDFAFHIGRASTIGWAPELKKPADQYPPFTVRDGVTITPDHCIAQWLVRGRHTRTLVLYQPDLDLEVRLVYSAERGRPWLRRRVALRARGSEPLAIDQAAHHVRWRTDARATLGGVGQPVALDATWFLGIEHPRALNTNEAQTIVLSQYPGRIFGRALTELESMVAGADETGMVHRVLDAYVEAIRRPTRSVTLYNTWCDLRGDEFTADAVGTTALELRRNLELHDTMFDMFVVDDGWMNRRSIWEERTDRVPGGLPGLHDVISRAGFAMGLWLPLSGHNLDTSWGEPLGYEVAHTKYYCMSGTNYNRTLRVRLKSAIQQANVEYFKHDFCFFTCGRTDHGHFPSVNESEEANVNAMIALLEYERSLNPRLYQAITTGIWPSPWWLPHCDTIWMGGADHDFDRRLPATRGSVFEMNYRDGALYTILEVNSNVFPLSAIMTHGIVDARHTVYDVRDEDDEGWANYVMNYLGRGTQMREFYITPANLNERRWNVLARGIRWARSLDPAMIRSRFILGDPRAGELFGFQGAGDGMSYASLRNPSLFPTNVALDALGFTNGICEIVYPWHSYLRCGPGTVVNVPGQLVLQLMNYPEHALARPVPLGMMAEVKRASDEETVYDVYLEPDIEEFAIAAPAGVKTIAGERISGDAQTLTAIVDDAATAQTAVAVTEAAISTAGLVRCTWSAPHGAEARLDVTVRHNGRLVPVASVNGVPSAPKTLRGDGWFVATVPGTLSYNEAVVGMQGALEPIPSVRMEAVLTVDRRIEPREVTITHRRAPQPPVKDRPLPVLQGVVRESFAVACANVTLGPESGLLSGKRLLTAEELGSITAAWLRVAVFDANGGEYSRKEVYLNNALAGLLPENPPPIARWHIGEIPLSREALAALTLDTRVSIKDKTGDLYKVQGFQLEVVLPDGKHVATPANSIVYSVDMTWSHAEGELLPRDGRTATVLSF